MKLRLARKTPYLTLQGEGPHVGTPAVFVRTVGCDLRCGATWKCDTPETLADYDHETHQWRETTKHAWEIDPEELADEVRKRWPNVGYIVLTGGEPMLQDDALAFFLASLHAAGSKAKVGIETNGRHWNRVLAEFLDHVVLSPKLDVYSPQVEGKTIESWLLWAAKDVRREVCLKIVCASPAEVEHAFTVLGWADSYLPIQGIVQPSNESDFQAIATEVMSHGRWRCIPQVHRILNLP